MVVEIRNELRRKWSQKEVLTHATTVRPKTKPEDITLSEISRSHKDKYFMNPLVWGSQIHRDREQNGDCQGWWERWKEEILINENFS